jgi:hypothetical protein
LADAALFFLYMACIGDAAFGSPGFCGERSQW